MTDVQIPVGFRRKTGMYLIVDPVGQILVDQIFDKILGNYFIFHVFPP